MKTTASPEQIDAMLRCVKRWGKTQNRDEILAQLLEMKQARWTSR